MSPGPAPIPSITSDFLIVGEGKGDAAFVRHLCEARGIDITNFQIEEAGGSGNFEAYVRGLSFRRSFDRAEGLLVVGDNDDSPDANFNQIRNYLKKAKLPCPNQRLQVARNGPQGVAVVVMMLPYTVAAGPTRGSLDTLLLTSVDDNNAAIGACINAYRACIPGDRKKNEEDKFRLRCFLAALYPEDPNISLQYALLPSRNLIDLNHVCFNEISDFLRGLPDLCRSPLRR